MAHDFMLAVGKGLVRRPRQIFSNTQGQLFGQRAAYVSSTRQDSVDRFDQLLWNASLRQVAFRSSLQGTKGKLVKFQLRPDPLAR